MKPLKIALVVKGTPATLKRDDRNMGYFSYAVPEFTWEHHVLNKNTSAAVFRAYDLVVVEDSSSGLVTHDRHAPPVVFLSIDSTLSDMHYTQRLEHARRADLVLVDHDSPARFASACSRVLQFPFCVNDHVFYSGTTDKTIDVNFHCASGAHKGHPGGVERDGIRGYLDGVCKDGGYRYVSGTSPLPEYAEEMRRSKVVVNWPRTPINRPHRIFDAMASGACVITGVLPPVIEDMRRVDVHYLEYENKEELPGLLHLALKVGRWKEYAEAGKDLVDKYHTWSIRARQLREIVKREFGI